MTNVLRQNSSKCIQWTVLPSTSPFVCDAFPFQDRKCCLELTLGSWKSSNSTYNPSYLKFKSNGKLKSAVKVIVRPSIAQDTSTSQGLTTQEQFITSEYQTIWTYSAGKNLSVLLLTFDIIIYDDFSQGEFSFFLKISTIEGRKKIGIAFDNCKTVFSSSNRISVIRIGKKKLSLLINIFFKNSIVLS